jgi:hypothetical protein
MNRYLLVLVLCASAGAQPYARPVSSGRPVPLQSVEGAEVLVPKIEREPIRAKARVEVDREVGKELSALSARAQALFALPLQQAAGSAEALQDLSYDVSVFQDRMRGQATASYKNRNAAMRELQPYHTPAEAAARAVLKWHARGDRQYQLAVDAGELLDRIRTRKRAAAAAAKVFSS